LDKTLPHTQESTRLMFIDNGLFPDFMI